jgi:hypothetical protein
LKEHLLALEGLVLLEQRQVYLVKQLVLMMLAYLELQVV